MKLHTLTRESRPALRELVWDGMERDKLTRTVLYTFAAPTLLDWMELTAPDQCNAVLVTDGGKVAAFSWVNGYIGRAAFIHFVVLRPFQWNAVEYGLGVTRYFLDSGHFDGLLGLTPAPYRHALRYIEKLGFAISPVRAPGACRLAAHNRYVDGVFSVLRTAKE